MAVMSFVMYMADKAKGNVPKDFSAKKFLVIAPIIGVTIGLCNKINLFLSGALPSAVMFPAVNGGSIILATQNKVEFAYRASGQTAGSVTFGKNGSYLGALSVDLDLFAPNRLVKQAHRQMQGLGYELVKPLPRVVFLDCNALH